LIIADDLKFNDAAFELPALWDDEEDKTKISYDIGPRVLYVHDTLGLQLVDDDGVGGFTYRSMHFGVAIIEDIPNLFQFTNQSIGLAAAAEPPLENVQQA